MGKSIRKSYKKIARRKNHKKTIRKDKKGKLRKYRKGGNLEGEEREKTIPTLKGLKRNDRVRFKVIKPIMEDDEEIENLPIGTIRTARVYNKPHFVDNDPDIYTVTLIVENDIFNFYFTNKINDNTFMNQIEILEILPDLSE